MEGKIGAIGEAEFVLSNLEKQQELVKKLIVRNFLIHLYRFVENVPIFKLIAPIILYATLTLNKQIYSMLDPKLEEAGIYTYLSTLIGARINIQVSKENTSTQSSLDMNLFEGGWTIEGETYKLTKYYENDKIGDYYKTKITQSVGISIPCFGYTIFDTDDVIGIERIYANIDEYNNHLLPEKIIISIEKYNPSLLSEENLQCVVDGAFNLLSPLKDIDYTGMDCIKIIYVFYEVVEKIRMNKEIAM